MTTSPLARVIECELSGDFGDPNVVWHTFLEVLNAVPGTTILTTTHHIFPQNGLSGVILIGESHAAIHTWPEEERAFALLASCSTDASLEAFERLLACHWTIKNTKGSVLR